MEVLAPAAANGNGTTPSPEPTDPLIVLEHIVNLIETALGAARRELEAVGSLLSKSKHAETLDRCVRFAADSQVALYAQKDRRDEMVNGHDDSPRIEHVYTLSSEFSSAKTTVASIAFLKRPSPLDASRPVAEQIHMVNLPSSYIADEDSRNDSQGTSPFEVLHSVLHNALVPYFEAYTRSQSSAGRAWYDSDAKSGIPGARRRLGELEMSLLHLQQNTDIPLVHLTMHPVVATALQEAETDGKQPTLHVIPSQILEDFQVLNGVQANVNSWVQSIKNVTKLVESSECGSAAQEINFWLSLESALARVEQTLQSPGVLLSLDVLKNAKRFQAGISLKDDTKLSIAQTTVHSYNALMRDFPLDELSSATTLTKIQDALVQIFSHIHKKLRLSTYPVKRALKLVEGISEDLNTQLHRVLRGKPLLSLSYDAFNDVMRTAEAIWATWEESVREFTTVARDLIRKRNTEFVPIKITPRHLQSQERLRYISTFRKNHEQLQKTIINVLGPTSSSDASRPASSEGVAIIEEIGDVDAVQEVAHAFNAIRDVDVLDTSAPGTEIWVQAELQYTERTSRVENSIIARLRDRLATAKTANEMFRVFAKFNALLVRPKVRGAIGEYQAQLLDNVKSDITSLHERFKQQYGGSETQMMSQLRDIPPIAGSILWVRQIEAQLDSYMKKVEAVLGQDWTLHTDGEKLQAESELFRKKLTTRNIYEAWLSDVQKRNSQISGRLFGIARTRGSNTPLELGVNFDNHIISLFKEVRNLTWLNFQVPHAISNVSKEAQRVYPFALSLMESVMTYLATSRAIQSMPEVAPLLAGYDKDAQMLFAKGVPLRWESFIHAYEMHVQQKSGATDVVRSDSKHIQYVRDLSSSVSLLQSKTTTLQSVDESIKKALGEIKVCPYDFKTLEGHFDTIQNGVDKLNLENYTNLAAWVKKLNQELHVILQDRLSSALSFWVKSFSDPPLQVSSIVEDVDGAVHQVAFPRITVEIMMNNQTIFIEPPLNFVKASWLSQLEEWLNVLCHLRLIKSSRYQISGAASFTQKEATFSDLAQGSVQALEKAFAAIDTRLGHLSEYLEEWYRYQSLWDLRSDQLSDTLGDDVAQWHQLLQEIRHARSTFDTSAVQKEFGTVIFNYEQIQSKITQKYDQWQYDVITKFGNLLGGRMSELFTELKRSRAELESQSLEASSTAQAVAFITVVQQCKRNSAVWEPEIEVFKQGQTTLSRQRYNFPNDWLPANQVGDEWDAFSEILSRKSRLVEDQTDALRAKIVAEDSITNARVSETISQWSEQKPVSGTIPPAEASDTLRSFQARLQKLQTDVETVSRAKEALGLAFNKDEILAATLEEVRDFMSVWSALSAIWQSMIFVKTCGLVSSLARSGNCSRVR